MLLEDVVVPSKNFEFLARAKLLLLFIGQVQKHPKLDSSNLSGRADLEVKTFVFIFRRPQISCTRRNYLNGRRDANTQI